MPDRMFVAVLLPDEARDALERMVEPRRDQEWRWMRPESWHVTLAFCAEVAPYRYEALVERLARAAARTLGFPLGIGGVGTFPSSNPDRAKVLYAGVDDPTGSLPALSVRCRTAATTSGIEVAQERFVAHLTLARSNRPVSATRWLRAMVATSTEQWQVADIVLIQSHLGQGSPRYELRERFPLAAP